MKKFDAAKWEHATNDGGVNSSMSTIRNETKRLFKKKESATINNRHTKKSKNLKDTRKIQAK